jgi:hypothetical protein
LSVMSRQQQQQQQQQWPDGWPIQPAIVHVNYDTAMTLTTRPISSKSAICLFVRGQIVRIFNGDIPPSPGMFSVVSATDVASLTHSPFLVLWYLLMRTVDRVDSTLLVTISILCIRQIAYGCHRDVEEASAMLTGLSPALLSSFSCDLVQSNVLLRRDDEMAWRSRCSALLSTVSKAGIAGNRIMSLNIAHAGDDLSRFSLYYDGNAEVLARALET